MPLFKRHLEKLVRAGTKRQTIRLWRRPLVRPGQISFSPGLGRLRITAVDELDSLQALTEADARADGFNSLSDLLQELRSTYAPPPAPGRRHYPKPAAKRSQRLYRVRFEWPLPNELEKALNAATKSRVKASRKRKSRQKSAPAHSLVARPAVPRRTLKPKARAKLRHSSTQRKALHAYILAHSLTAPTSARR